MNFQFHFSRKAKLITAAVVAAPLLAFSIYTWSALTYSYSKGVRGPGYVQKFSKKGWVCKTWEGELALLPLPGTFSPERFNFTVRDDVIAQYVNATLGKRVELTYEQHKGIPTTCFGETEYFVTAVRVIP
jgi:hypothetical protein